MNKLIADMPEYAAPAFTKFEDLPSRLRRFATEDPEALAVTDESGTWTRAELVSQAHRIANRLISSGLRRGDTVAVLAANSREYVALIIGTLAAGGCLVPLSGLSTRETLALMIDDCDTNFLFLDSEVSQSLPRLPQIPNGNRVLLDNESNDTRVLTMPDWLGDVPDSAPALTLTADDAFNIIYSSGTTGQPKGIVHDHGLRSQQYDRFIKLGFVPGCVTLLATPIYSNTTMVALLPTLQGGGHVVLMKKFNAAGYLALAQEHRTTHTILIPVQYQRILAEAAFDQTDLSSFKMKLSSGAPLRSPIIKELVTRWPGTLLEIYGMTEGGGSTVLNCTEFPEKWDSVGQAGEGTVLHVIDEQGNILPPNTPGELVGRGATMMRGYYKRPDQNREIVWRDSHGDVFFRTGDMARIDEQGFVFLLDRRKDMILSGGFNIYAEDLEKVLANHNAVIDVAVIAVPSETWGETPLGIVVLQSGRHITEDELKEWANDRLGKTQRLSAIEFRNELPRNPLGKIMKRELRAPFWEIDA